MESTLGKVIIFGLCFINNVNFKRSRKYKDYLIIVVRSYSHSRNSSLYNIAHVKSYLYIFLNSNQKGITSLAITNSVKNLI